VIYKKKLVKLHEKYNENTNYNYS